jgi:hypothetical protein
MQNTMKRTLVPLSVSVFLKLKEGTSELREVVVIDEIHLRPPPLPIETFYLNHGATVPESPFYRRTSYTTTDGSCR